MRFFELYSFCACEGRRIRFSLRPFHIHCICTTIKLASVRVYLQYSFQLFLNPGFLMVHLLSSHLISVWYRMVFFED